MSTPFFSGLAVGVFVAEMLQDMFETAMIASWLMKTTTIERDLEDFAPDKMNNLDRILGMTFMVLPKLGIAFWLTGVGSRFVALSKNNAELILNCLAVGLCDQTRWVGSCDSFLSDGEKTCQAFETSEVRVR